MINREKLKEAKRVQLKIGQAYNDRALGLAIAQGILKTSHFDGMGITNGCRSLNIVEEKVRQLGHKIMDFEIFFSDSVCEISYDSVTIENKREFMRCKKDFLKETCIIVNTIRNTEWLKIETKSFVTLVNEFLDKVEESFEE